MAERIVERLIRERDTRYGDGIYTTTQIQFAWNSNHMEGSTLTAKQTAQLFATGTYTTDGSEQVNPDDALETRNHFAAFRWILDHADEPVDRGYGLSPACHSQAGHQTGLRLAFQRGRLQDSAELYWQSCHSDKDCAAAGCSRIYGQAV